MNMLAIEDNNIKGIRPDEIRILGHFTEAVARVFTMLRKKKGYTSYESFAFDYDFPRAQYWRIERGKDNLTLRTLVKLLLIHKLTLEEFLQLVTVEVQNGKRRS